MITTAGEKELRQMKLTMLGTGNALVTECYNACFIIEDNGQLFMTDGGGGNTILHQIKHAGYTEEGSRYYHGTLWIPNDLDSVEIQ